MRPEEGGLPNEIKVSSAKGTARTREYKVCSKSAKQRQQGET